MIVIKESLAIGNTAYPLNSVRFRACSGMVQNRNPDKLISKRSTVHRSINADSHNLLCIIALIVLLQLASHNPLYFCAVLLFQYHLQYFCFDALFIGTFSLCISSIYRNCRMVKSSHVTCSTQQLLNM